MFQIAAPMNSSQQQKEHIELLQDGGMNIGCSSDNMKPIGIVTRTKIKHVYRIFSQNPVVEIVDLFLPEFGSASSGSTEIDYPGKKPQTVNS